MTESFKLAIEAADGTRNTLFVAGGAALAADAPLLLVKPAMGVRASFYAPLFEAFAAQGMRVATCDLRGHGRSSVRPSRKVDFGFHEMIELDWSAELDALAARFPGAPRVLLGHSLGGQLSFLFAAAHPRQVDAVAAVATCSVYWRAFGPLAGVPVAIGTQLARALGFLLGVYPGDRLGFAGREARTVIGDWARQARTGRYEPAGSSAGYEQLLGQWRGPGLILTLGGDRYAPVRAADHLAAKMPLARLERRHLDQPRLRSPHFRWVRGGDRVVTEVARWIRGAVGC